VDENEQNWLVAVSSTSDPTGTWNPYRVSMTNVTNRCGDYPELGSSHYFTIMTIVVFDNSNCEASTTIVDSEVVAIDTSSMLAGNPAPGSTMWTGVHDPGDSLATQISPAVQYYLRGGGQYDDAILVDSYAGGGSHVTVWRIDAQRQQLYGTRISTPRYRAPVDVAQPSDSGGFNLDPGDSRITSSMLNTYGLYAAIDTRLTSSADHKAHDGVLALRIDADRGEEGVTSAVNITDAPNDLINPSYAGDASGDGELTMAEGGANTHIADLAVGLNYNGVFSRYRTVLSNSDVSLTSDCSNQRDATTCRFGDYTSIYPDPGGSNVFWTFDEYFGNVDNHGTTPGWKTRIGEYLHDS